MVNNRSDDMDRPLLADTGRRKPPSTVHPSSPSTTPARVVALVAPAVGARSAQALAQQ